MAFSKLPDPSRAAYVKTKPRVQAYMEQHRASVRAGLVQHEVEGLAKFNISREQIHAKWREFGNIDPALGYNTNSQGKALKSLWSALGYADAGPKKPDEGEGDSKPNIYVAKWMRPREEWTADEIDKERAEKGPRQAATIVEPRSIAGAFSDRASAGSFQSIKPGLPGRSVRDASIASPPLGAGQNAGDSSKPRRLLLTPAAAVNSKA